MKPVSKIVADMTKSVGASGAQFLITLVTTPLMTRLYVPETYATFSIILSIATVTVGIGLFSLPQAYPLEKDPARRAEIMRTMLILLSLLILGTTIAAIIMMLRQSYHAGIAALALMPVLVLTLSIRHIMVSIATTHANFSSIALGQSIEPFFSRGGSIALGAAAGGHPAFILGSVALGHLITAITIGKKALHDEWRSWRTATAKPLAVLRRHHDFVVFHTLSQQPQSLVFLGLQMAIAGCFTTHLAGQYVLAISILIMPANLIALATSSVLYRHFIELSHTAPERLAAALERAILLYLFAGIALLAPILLFGETIFAFVFGETWRGAGHIAAILSVAYTGTFVVTATQSVFRITGHLKLQFKLEAALGALVLIIAIACFKTMPFNNAMICLAAAWWLRHGAILIASIWSARHFSNTEVIP